MNPSDDPELPIRPWKRLRSEAGEHMMLFRSRWDWMCNPRNGEELRRLVLEVPAWVNVIARTATGSIVFVRQYRFGTSSITLEIPGGMVDRGEEHGAAARRELAEETGYTAESWTYLGCVEPNPAFQDNLCHHWLAEGALRTKKQELDIGEDIEIIEFSEAEVCQMIATGTIRHSLVLTALAHILDLRTTSR